MQAPHGFFPVSAYDARIIGKEAIEASDPDLAL
jgi:hypothetical protein